jgi:hypothetical protein
MREATKAQATFPPRRTRIVGTPDRIVFVHGAVQRRRHRSTRNLSQEFIMKKTALTKDDWHVFSCRTQATQELSENDKRRIMEFWYTFPLFFYGAAGLFMS